jgi:hypothetical protein
MKFENLPTDDGNELDEDSLLESPLDTVEPYSLFKTALLGKDSQPN